MSPNPFSLRCRLSLLSCIIGFIFGTNLKSIFTNAVEGRTVFAPGPPYPDVKPAILQVGSPVSAFLISTLFLLPINRLIPYSFLNDLVSKGSEAMTLSSSFVNSSTSLYQSFTSILPSLSRKVFRASTSLHAGFSMRTARLECASRIDSCTDNSTYKRPFIPRLIIDLSFSST